MTHVLSGFLALAALGAVWFVYNIALTRLTRLPKLWRRVVEVSLAVLLVGGFLSLTVSRFLPNLPAWRPLLAVFLTGVAFLFYLALVLVPLLITAGVRRLAGFHGAPASDAPPRRALPSGRAAPPAGRWLRGCRTVVVGALAVSAAVTAYGSYAFHCLVTAEVTVAAADLPAAFDGFRIALVTDIHLGPVTTGADVQAIVERVNAAQPDLIVLAGDLVDGSVEDLGGELSALSGLQAREGTVVTTGNHEFRLDTDAWLAAFQSYGLRVLDNSALQIQRSGVSFDVIGVNDRQGSGAHGANLAKAAQMLPGGAAAAVGGAGRFRLLIAHEPVQALMEDNLPAALGVDVQLSGHTHGGQLWPLGLFVRLSQPVVSGVHTVGGVQVVTSKGTGSWGPPVRVGARPEVVIVTLRPA
ncbi:MAG: metallophosphoesterase [Propionibacteriaceae bacterium]|nr:metallophosphoesterase [Propionibacteriaceae bacterium]